MFDKWNFVDGNTTGDGTLFSNSAVICYPTVANTSRTFIAFVKSANSAPSVTPDNASRTVSEGSHRNEHRHLLGLRPGRQRLDLGVVGAVTKTGTNNGTWTGPLGTTDGPAQSQTVTITANDGNGGTATTTFALTVNNVAPTATFNAPASVNEGSPIGLSLTSPSDPSSCDTTAGFTYAFDCGSGYGAFSAHEHGELPDERQRQPHGQGEDPRQGRRSKRVHGERDGQQRRADGHLHGRHGGQRGRRPHLQLHDQRPGTETSPAPDDRLRRQRHRSGAARTATDRWGQLPVLLPRTGPPRARPAADTGLRRWLRRTPSR